MRRTVKKFRKSEFLRNVFTLVSATSVAQAIALAIYPILTRIYNPSEHGLFALYMSIIAITAIVSTGKYELAVMIPKKEKEGISLVMLSLILAFLFSVLLFLFILVFDDRIPVWLGNPDISGWLFYIPLSTFLIGAFQALGYWNNRHKQYRLIAAGNLGQSLTNSSVKLTTSSAIPSGGGLIAGAVAGQLTGLLIYLWKFLKNDLKIAAECTRRNVYDASRNFNKFPRYNMLHYLTNNFSSNLPVFVFSSWFSSVEVGFYSLGFMMINRPMGMITSSFTQVFSQRVIEKFNREQKIFPDVKALTLRLGLIFFLPFLLAGIFGPVLFGFIFGDEWVEAGKYMQILSPWLFVVLISSPLSFLPDMLGHQKKAMWIDLGKFILRIGGLSIGVIMNNIYLSLILFSGISCILVVYNLYWYVNLSIGADTNLLVNKAS